MQVFKAFLKIVKKHMLVICIYSGVYAFLLFLVTSTSEESMNEYFEASSVDISVIDREHSASSKALTEYLGNMHNLIEVEDEESVIQDYIYYRYVRYILIIPEGFEEKLMAGEIKNLVQSVWVPGSSQGRFLENQIDIFLREIQMLLAGGFEKEEALAAAWDTTGSGETVQMLHFEAEKESGSDGVFYCFQYLPYIYILLMVCGLAPILFILGKREIYERTMCAPITLMQRNLQVVLGGVCYSIFVYALFAGLAFLLCGKGMFRPELKYLLINSGVFLVFAVAMTIFICMVGLSGEKTVVSSLNLIANIVGLGMSFLCGVFVPQSLLSDQVLAAAKFLPAYWYIKNNNMLAGFSEEAFSEGSFWTGVGIQALFAVVMFTGALVASRVKQQRRV